MGRLEPVHGGTDSLPEPRYDFSSNANPLGPCPSVLAAVRAADLRLYPDPHYTRLRSRLAAFHGVSPDRLVVGAGASELILRLIRRIPGTVQQLVPTFSEYARGAKLSGRRLLSLRSPAAFLRAQARHPGLGFLCWPNNPTGDCWPADFVRQAARTGPLVLDLAYAPLCNPAEAAEIEGAAAAAYRLYSPNKAFGLTGVRGAYVITPRSDAKLADAAPSWVIGREAVAFLESSIEPRARKWLASALPKAQQLRAHLATSLRQAGMDVRESPATFLLANVGDAARVVAELRGRGIRVRDAGSFGLPQWVRLSGQLPDAQKALLKALKVLKALNALKAPS
jgi:histidinol-phosphate aminotransferase